MSNENKILVEKINTAFSENKIEDFLTLCNEDVKWTMVGDQTFVGKDAIRTFMSSMEGMEAPKFTVAGIIADEENAVGHGDMSMKNNDGVTENYGYCDVYRFSGGKVAELTSYIVKTKV